MGGIHFNHAVAAPPAGWEKLGLNPAYSVRSFDDLEALQRYCRDKGAAEMPPTRQGQPYLQACTVRGDEVVALPSPKAWPSRGEIEELRRHEYAHTWGLVHDPAVRDNRETWQFRNGTPAFPLNDSQVLMMRSLAGHGATPAAPQPEPSAARLAKAISQTP